MIHVCTNCYKTFKTTQHLNQHKNKKRSCESSVEGQYNSNNLEKDTLISNVITSNVLSNNNNIDNSYNLLTENNTSEENKMNVSAENNTSEENKMIVSVDNNTSEENKMNVSVDNLSVANLLDFVNTHKKNLEEKNKLESTLIILKKHVEKITKENLNLKNKLNFVNDFISNYKSNSVEDFDCTGKYSKPKVLHSL